MELSAERWSYQKLYGVVNNKGLYAQHWLTAGEGEKQKNRIREFVQLTFLCVWSDDWAEDLLVVEVFFFIIVDIFKEVKYVVYNDNSTCPPTINQ